MKYYVIARSDEVTTKQSYDYVGDCFTAKEQVRRLAMT